MWRVPHEPRAEFRPWSRPCPPTCMIGRLWRARHAVARGRALTHATSRLGAPWANVGALVAFRGLRSTRPGHAANTSRSSGGTARIGESVPALSAQVLEVAVRAPSWVSTNIRICPKPVYRERSQAAPHTEQTKSLEANASGHWCLGPSTSGRLGGRRAAAFDHAALRRAELRRLIVGWPTRGE